MYLSAWGVQWGEAQVWLVGHQVWSLHLQDGLISGQSCQVSVAHHLVVHSGLNTHRSQVSVGVYRLIIQVSLSRCVYRDASGGRPRGARALGRRKVDWGYLSLHL